LEAGLARLPERRGRLPRPPARPPHPQITGKGTQPRPAMASSLA